MNMREKRLNLISERYKQSIICDMLVSYQNANNIFIDVLLERIKYLEEEVTAKEHEGWFIRQFFREKHPELINEYVNLCYQRMNEDAEITHGHVVDAISSFHDDMYDLSTIPCAKDDFQPWDS